MFSRCRVDSSFFTEMGGGVVKEEVKRFVFEEIGGSQVSEKVAVRS